MDNLELDALIIKLQHSSIKDIEEQRQLGLIKEEELPYVLHWLKQKKKERLKNLPKVVISTASSFLVKVIKYIFIKVKTFWLKEYKWVIGTLIAISGIVVMYLKS
jgi:hypothetical protein